MVALYVTSSEKGSGKTTVCAGLGKTFADSGKTVGFFKPIIADSQNPSTTGADSDTTFMKRLLALEEPVELLSPILPDKNNLPNKIKEAYNKISRGKDIVIIEGISGINQTAGSIVSALDARVLVIESYGTELLKESDSYHGNFGKNLLGVLINNLPPSLVDHLHDEVSNRLGKKGVSILGSLPENRILVAPTVGELAEMVHGELISNTDDSAELVENIMLGGMSVDSGLEYMSHKVNKAVIVRNERSDMQLAALETSTRCLVITGSSAPRPIIVARAKEKSIPIILTGDDISTITTSIEAALSTTTLKQENKLPVIVDIMKQHLNLQVVYQGLGIAA